MTPTPTEGAEEWRTVAGWPYEVSSLGRVRRDGRILHCGPDRKGYRRVTLCGGSREITKHARVHQLVAAAFLSRPEGATQVNHIDGDKLNNVVTNLEYLTHMEHERHSLLNGLKAHGVRHGCAKLTEAVVLEIRDSNESTRVLARRHGVVRNTIRDIRERLSWRHLPERADRRSKP